MKLNRASQAADHQLDRCASVRARYDYNTYDDDNDDDNYVLVPTATRRT